MKSTPGHENLFQQIKNTSVLSIIYHLSTLEPEKQTSSALTALQETQSNFVFSFYVLFLQKSVIILQFSLLGCPSLFLGTLHSPWEPLSTQTDASGGCGHICSILDTVALSKSSQKSFLFSANNLKYSIPVKILKQLS